MAKKNKIEIPDTVQSPKNINGVNITQVKKKPFFLLRFRVQASLLALIGFVFYWNTFSHECAFDDMMAISENEYVQEGVAGIPDILTRDAYQSYLESRNGSNQLTGGRYRPLSLITFAVEQQLLGVAHYNESDSNKDERIAHDMHTRHVVNVLLYILSVVALLYFLRQVVFPTQPWVAFIAALLFIIHPIHTEVVANVKSRDEILSLLFITLTFIKAFRYRDSKKLRDLVWGLLYFFLALLSKEYAVTLILLLPVGFYVFRKEGVSGSIMAAIPYLAPLGIYLLLRFSAVTAIAEGAEHNILNNPYLYATGAQRIATEIMVLLDYLKLLVFPNPLSADYSYNAIPYTDFLNPAVWLSLIVYAGLAVSMCLLLARRHVLGFAIAIYLANLALVSNILFDIGAPMGERLIYHSSVGFCMAVAYLLYMGFEKIKRPAIAKAGLAGLMVILITLCGFKTIERNKDWKNDQTLFMKDVQTVPNSIKANNNAAAACMLFAKQTYDDAKRKEWFGKAITYFDKAISIYPMYINARLNRGLSYFDMGEPDMAIPDWDTVRKYDPEEKKVNNYFSALGRYYLMQGIRYNNTGKKDSAIIIFKKGTEVVPGDANLWFKLGDAYMAEGRLEASDSAFKKAEHLKVNAKK